MNNKISDIDKHFLDQYIKWMANKKVMVTIAILILIIGFVSSLATGNQSYFSRSGSLSSMIGTLLTLSPMFYNGIYLSRPEVFRWATSDNKGIPIQTTEEGRKVSINIMYGVILIILSSFISIFGDLLPLH
ncbi:TPA: hypothetical protein ACLNPE_003543 [Vibrio cholerae O1]